MSIGTDTSVNMKTIENDVYEIILKGSVFDEDSAKEIIESGGLDKYIEDEIDTFFSSWRKYSICEYIDFIETMESEYYIARHTGLPYHLVRQAASKWYDDHEDCDCDCLKNSVSEDSDE